MLRQVVIKSLRTSTPPPPPFSRNLQQQCRAFSAEELLKYKRNSPEYKCLKKSLKQIAVNPMEIPIVIGEIDYHARDIHMQRMPHNWRCTVARMSWANNQIVNLAIEMASEAQTEWCTVPITERVAIWRKCADILANEDRHLLNASIMLGQSKTWRQAEEDTCRTINDLRYFSEMLAKNANADGELCEQLMRSTGGFVAAMTPYNWTSWSANLALCPALMGNCVLWMPSPFNVLSCYLVYKALQKAELPFGVINFIPSNRSFFVDNITKSPYLAGINYAGRTQSYHEVANAVSAQMHRHNSFQSVIGPKVGKNFHFIHESADIDAVAEATILAAFDYSGQRGSSCECLFVPASLWCNLKEALVTQINELQIGDVCDFETQISAVISKISYEHIVELLKHAEESPTCEIICGGNYRATHGYYIEPTLIECKNLETKIMLETITGPVLSVYVYENEKLQEFVEQLKQNFKFTLSGAIFSKDETVAQHIGEALKCVAANLYINKPCIGAIDGLTMELPSITQEINADAKCQLHHWLPM